FWSSQSVAVEQNLQPAMGVWLQVPVAGSQVPAVWHWSEAVHTTGFAPTLAPAAQESARVQTLSSSRTMPSAWPGRLRAPQAQTLQESVVQAFRSSRSVAVVQSLQPAMGVWPHEPKTQESAVQGFRSSQAVASAQFGLMLTQFSPESPPVPV